MEKTFDNAVLLMGNLKKQFIADGVKEDTATKVATEIAMRWLETVETVA